MSVHQTTSSPRTPIREFAGPQERPVAVAGRRNAPPRFPGSPLGRRDCGNLRGCRKAGAGSRRRKGSRGPVAPRCSVPAHRPVESALLGYAGDPIVPAPNIDRLAADGIVFQSAYTACPVCMPSRCSLLSGLYPHNHGLWGNSSDFMLPPASAPMFRDIRRCGYTTAQIGKLHWTGGTAWQRQFETKESYYRALGLDVCEDIPEPFATPNSHGSYEQHLRKIGRLDAYCRDIAERVAKGRYYVKPSAVEPPDYNDTFVADRAMEFLKAQPLDKPYCLVASFPGPHPPMDAPGRYANLVPPERDRVPPNVPEHFSYEGTNYDPGLARRVRGNYYGKMALIDDQIGRLIQALQQRGTWNNTLVIFSADHGEMMGRTDIFPRAGSTKSRDACRF